MITIENVRDFPHRARGAYVTIGNFDGVHWGHARLISELVRRAGEAGAPALAVTFHPHPAALLRPELAPEPLVWLDREIELLTATGVTDVAVFKTGAWLLELSARHMNEPGLRSGSSEAKFRGKGLRSQRRQNRAGQRRGL